MDQIIHSINAVGFPIVAFLLIFWQGNTIIRANTKAINNFSRNNDKKIKWQEK